MLKEGSLTEPSEAAFGRAATEAAVEETEEPDVITNTAAISACEKGQQWELALSLLGILGAPS